MCPHKDIVFLRQRLGDLNIAHTASKTENNKIRIGLIIACQQCGEKFRQWITYNREERDPLNEKINVPYRTFDV